ncbi:putative thioredoxin [Dinoroseobacter shibae DFL 12 = DSM 16493]|jgi:cytochrome c biogenesis protein CcmG/thiol:disulfide interchange protein DsbE|uniref:Putative thioredoxin n=1 Tax=Dinoroseobacter shibae (strain DSM 16493 / NCIMB 14021 / DFL 12) TaxID=398580 RepID=A8LN81_DINSH|nr:MULTISPECIES: redoxin family protein [Dinoroseobacter]ABV93594.1 putative thioredoxin [Dinoroseobacter shibae DFL 12 = DSM 16493]MDD9715307.1 redoxin family protein [Dinoroseobacter sp. PD6]URF45047.1 redoxin family protein [Dinoroseobacter shibae]URF49351.1 redoxin family protein [Dinoroseobacter shibae]
MRRREALLTGGAVLASAGAGYIASTVFLRDDAPPPPEPGARAGRPAPPLTLGPLRDQPFLTYADLTVPGPKLVNWWASWCAPCRAEHPSLMALAAEGVPIHGITHRDTEADSLGFLAELGSPFAKLGADTTLATYRDWNLTGLPETYVLNGEGRVVLRHAGPVLSNIVRDYIRPALAAV